MKDSNENILMVSLTIGMQWKTLHPSLMKKCLVFTKQLVIMLNE